MECSNEKPCNQFDCPDCQNERYRKQYAMRLEVERDHTRLERELASAKERCQQIVIGASKLAQEARRCAAQECVEIIKSKTGMDNIARSRIVNNIKDHFGLEI